MTRRLILVAALAGLAFPAGPAGATHKLGHAGHRCCPGTVAFASDFVPPADAEWGYPIGGWGGLRRGAPLGRVPVIFVHGQYEDASYFDVPGDLPPIQISVRRALREAGYTDQEVWAMSYNGARCPDLSCQTYNEVNAEDIRRFVEAVRVYTGADRVSLVGHSLGVTVVRRALAKYPDLQTKVDAFVAIAGANHGITSCRGTDAMTTPCDEVHQGSAWLGELNGPNGERETPGRVRYMTVYDGSGAADVFYLGPDAESPSLAGAENRRFPGVTHGSLARGTVTVPVYLEFLEKGVVRVLGAKPARPAASRELPATGVTRGTGAAATPLVVALMLAAATLRGQRAFIDVDHRRPGLLERAHKAPERKPEPGAEVCRQETSCT